MIHQNLPDNDLSDLTPEQKLELLELATLSRRLHTSEEGLRAGIIMMQDEFDRKSLEDLPLLVMVIHADASYTMYRKTGWGELRAIRKGWPEENEE